MATVAQIFRQVSMVNPKTSCISSIGTFVSANAQQTADFVAEQIASNLPEGSLALTILRQSNGNLTEKQMWVISYELLKNADYCKWLDEEAEEINRAEEWRKAKARAKRAEKKAHGHSTIHTCVNKSTATTYEAGAKVNHPTFGEGIIITSDNKVTVVRFNDSERRLATSYAKLEVL